MLNKVCTECMCRLYLLCGFVTRLRLRVRACAWVCVFICVRKWTHEGLQMPSIKTQLRPLPSERGSGSGRGIEIWATHKYRILKSAHKFVFIAALISILIHWHVRVCECVQQTSCAYRTHTLGHTHTVYMPCILLCTRLESKCHNIVYI